METDVTEDFVGRGGVKIAPESNADHRAMKSRGAVVVSAAGRGGVTKPVLRFRAFNVVGGAMTVTEAQTGANPSPRTKEVPLEDMAGFHVPGLGSLPPIRTGDAPRDPVPVPIGDMVAPPTPEPSRIIVPNFVEKPVTLVTSGLPARQVPNKSITFIGEFAETEFLCHEVLYEPESGWLSLVFPSETVVRLKPNQELDIRIGGKEKKYWFTGVHVPLPAFGITVRVFAEVRASQE